jgi:hypothetical protein
MEINLIPVGDNPRGALATEDMTEGRFVLLTSHTWDVNYGSTTDLPGVKLPDTDAEALKARFAVQWPAPDRVVGPDNLWIVGAPSRTFALRGGMDQAPNLPMTNVDVWTTYPGNMESEVIPSGTRVRIYHNGAELTLPSGQYVYNASLRTPGALCEVLNSGDDGADNAGKLGYSATGTIAEVVQFNATTAALTVRLLK